MRLALIALALAAALAVPAAAATPSYVVRSDTKIGTYAVKSDGSLAGAIRAFGTPRLKGGNEACTATWPAHGLTIGFYNLGGQNSCTPRYSRFNKAFMHGRQWMTNRGLRIGMAVREIRRYYPQATFRRGQRFFWPSGWWLVTRHSQFGLGGTYPGLLAETRNGTVASLQVRFAAGGD
jgi:hypothetical protein